LGMFMFLQIESLKLTGPVRRTVSTHETVVRPSRR
jgi:hypothetical protein